MGIPLLTLQNIALTFGGTPLLEDASLAVAEGSRICIVGRNGSGKSTLLKIAAGLIEPDRGTRFIHPGVTLRYLPQEPDFGAQKTVRDCSAPSGTPRASNPMGFSSKWSPVRAAPWHAEVFGDDLLGGGLGFPLQKGHQGTMRVNDVPDLFAPQDSDHAVRKQRRR